MSQVEKRTVVQLRQALLDRGLCTKGKKAALSKRLRLSDLNNEPAPEQDPEPELRNQTPAKRQRRGIPAETAIEQTTEENGLIDVEQENLHRARQQFQLYMEDREHELLAREETRKRFVRSTTTTENSLETI